MAVDIESFKHDLDLLKNQRSVIQAKLDDANKRVAELTETLKGMGFNSVDDAKQAYARQLAEAEGQHALVKQLIQEINNVDVSLPSREDVMARLTELSKGVVSNVSPVPNVTPVTETVPVQGVVSSVVHENVPMDDVPSDMFDSGVTSSVQEGSVSLNNSSVQAINNGDIDLGGLLFNSL